MDSENNDFIYLDSNATTPLAPEVVKEMEPFLVSGWGNPSSSHRFGMEAKQAIESSRANIAKMIGCAESEIAITSGGSEANNFAIKGAALQRQPLGNHIITTNIEHPAVDEVLNYLSSVGFSVTFVPVERNGIVDAKKIEAAITPKTILITVMHANNEVGSIQPIAEISAIASRHNGGILVHTDASQSIGKIPVNIKDLGVDLLTITPHKFYGPKGIGALFIKNGVVLQKLIHGAGHERGLRAGTENTLGIVGFGAACRLITNGIESDHMKETRDLLQNLLLEKLHDVIINGPKEDSLRLPNTLNISFKGISSGELLKRIGFRIAASAGAACHGASVSKVLTAIHVPEDYVMGSIRFSTGKLVSLQQIRNAAELVASAVNELRSKRH